jgi:prepilin peptidase CpaA
MFNQHLTIATACLIAFLVAVVVSDLRSRRIPNLLTVPAAAVGLAINFTAAGGSGALASAAGLCVGLAAFLPFFIVRGFGAGDVKAMAAVGAFLGPKGALLAALSTLIAGALCGVLFVAAIGGYPAVQSVLRRCALRVCMVFATGQAASIEPPPGDAALRRFPYGVAIACGTIASLSWS